MSSAAWYNENDNHAADWLEELIEAGEIAYGVVDRRSIEEVTPEDLAGYNQCHFFAGIGGWSYALRQAGVPDSTHVWTGSCPCQPFSNAGARKGVDDDRHLWPIWYALILQCSPSVVFGEQVSSPLGREWLDHVLADLEDVGFTVGSCDIPACSVGAAHRRQRLWFGGWNTECDVAGLADYDNDGHDGEPSPWVHTERSPGDNAVRCGVVSGRSVANGMADPLGNRPQGWVLGGPGATRGGDSGTSARRGGTGGGDGDTQPMGNPGVDGARQHLGELPGNESQHVVRASTGHHPPLPPGAADHTGATRGPWAGARWAWCQDGTYRPLEPGLVALVDGPAFRLADGRTPVREVSRSQILKGLGNAIVPAVAAVFVREFLNSVRDVNGCT